LNSFPILSSIIILPLFGALVSMLVKGSEKDVSKNTIDKQNKSRNIAITPTDDEVQKQIKETLEKLQTSKSKAAKYRKEKRDTHKKRSEDQEKTESENEEQA